MDPIKENYSIFQTNISSPHKKNFTVRKNDLALIIQGKIQAVLKELSITMNQTRSMKTERLNEVFSIKEGIRNDPLTRLNFSLYRA